ncbi:MAG TPA: aminotransferase class I/II-fold pyridoxal phosphate-dependent enzyme, partial [Pyrinomonadaceae bacterium]|nr:aminotransferase class I/II-fold pyridoxal phosphate-dependent enzyme [Pyrinomonadaceae bacterium]
MSKRFIPVSAPALCGRELEYVTDCVESSWISSCGKYVGRFESRFADFCGARQAVSCCNGTAALHLALLALGVGPGDEVIVPTLTFVATANAVTYCGARPRFADVDPRTWTLDPRSLEALITPRTKAVLPVHLYGHPADMDAVNDIA